jgi:polyhydroxyalkanoate synthesis regulator phasin
MDTEKLKKMAYMVLGYITIEPEKLKEMATQLAASGKVSEEEGHALVDEMVSKFKGVKADVEERIDRITEGIVDKLNRTQSKKLSQIGKRISSLEKRGMAKIKSVPIEGGTKKVNGSAGANKSEPGKSIAKLAMDEPKKQVKAAARKVKKAAKPVAKKAKAAVRKVKSTAKKAVAVARKKGK